MIKSLLQVNERTPLWPIAIARILIGALWLFSLRWKLPPDFSPEIGRGLMDWLELEVQFAAFEVYGRFIQEIVLPNFMFFAWLVFLAELAVGLSLLLGLLTRVTAVVGIFLAINLAIGLLEVPGEWPWSYVMLFMWHGVFLVAGAGRVMGVDGRLRRGRFSNSRLVWLT